jgi:hypothetical protein
MNIDLTYRKENINGISIRILKSALQKYIRRNDYDKGIYSLSLLDILELEKTNVNAKRIRTNMINRLIVSMSEEVNIHEDLPIIFKELYNNWQQNRTKEKSKKYLFQMYKLLVNSKKNRLISDLRTVYNLPEYYDKDFELLEFKHKILHENFNIDCLYNKPHDFEKFKEKLENKNIDCFADLSYLLKDNKNIKKIWKYLLTKNNEQIEALYYFYRKMTHKEKYLYLYHSILLLIYNPVNNKLEIPKINLKVKKQKFDDFVNDIHTGNKDKTVVDFALEGAIVINEDKRFFIEKFRTMYVEFKKYLLMNKIDLIIKKFNIKLTDIENDSEITKLPHAQKITSSYKKVVYVDTKKVYKGLYNKDDKLLFNNIINTKLVQVLEEFLGFSKKERTFLEISEILKLNNKYYLVFNNVTKVDLNDYTTETTKLEKNVKILKRNSIKRVSDIEDTITDDMKILVLQHLYIIYLLNVGDYGSHNILVKKDRITGIDLEEVRGTKKLNLMNVFFKKISKKQETIYKSFMKKIKHFKKELTEEQKNIITRYYGNFELINNNIKAFFKIYTL